VCLGLVERLAQHTKNKPVPGATGTGPIKLKENPIMTQTITDSRLVAKDLLAKGVRVYPVVSGQKAPKGKNWQLSRLVDSDIDELFGPGSNILRLNGEPSSWQVDVDADTPEAAAAAKVLLPHTAWVHGHPENPESHYTFICIGAETMQLVHPIRQADAEGKKCKKMLVEIRSTGSGTIMPGSRHPNGQFYCFYKDGKPSEAMPPDEEPATLKGVDLMQKVKWIATIALLAPEWGEGSRQAMTLHLSGGLLHGGMTPEDVAEFIRALCIVAGDEEVEKRVQAVHGTAEKFAAGENVTGFTSLSEFIMEKAILIQVKKWLELNSEKPSCPAASASGRKLVTLNGDFAAELEDTVTNLLAANIPMPKYFNFNGAIAIVETATTPRIKTLDVDTAREAVADEMLFMEESDSDKDIKLQRPHRDLLSSLIKSSRVLRFPELSRLIHAPVMGRNGSLHTQYGYLEATKAFQCMKGLESLVEISEVSEEDVAHALALFNDGPLAGFAFDSEASRTHAFCGMIQPIVRSMFSGPTPLYLIEAPTAGTGKTILARFIALVNAPSIQDTILPQDESEREKLVLSLLSALPEAILLDNITGFVKSPTLDKVLTSDVYTGRVLGVSKTASLPNTALWLATGNNVSFFGDLLTRTLRIGLDTGLAKPMQCAEYVVPDLDAWMDENRIAAMTALVTLVRFWHQKGMPKYQGDKRYRMPLWLKIMGGICEAVGLKDFLGNGDVMEDMDTETQDWTRFFTAWHQQFGVKAVTSKQLIRVAFGSNAYLSNYDAAEMGLAEPGPLSSAEAEKRTPQGRVTMLTSILKKQKGRPFASWKLVVERGTEATYFRLEPTMPYSPAV
jgi:hypothetical protein